MSCAISEPAGGEIRFWKEGWTPNGAIEIPDGYVRLARGNHFVTTQAKKLTKAMGQTVYVEMKKDRKRHFNSAIACWVPEEVIEPIRRKEEETRERREKQQQRAAKAREKKHEAELTRLASRLGELYPGLDEVERMGVVRRAFEVGSNRVGRCTKLEEDKKLELALIAHVRHTYTNYDELLTEFWDREDARRRIAYDVDAIMVGLKLGVPATSKNDD
jgi:hypothetical protein